MVATRRAGIPVCFSRASMWLLATLIFAAVYCPPAGASLFPDSSQIITCLADGPPGDDQAASDGPETADTHAGRGVAALRIARPLVLSVSNLCTLPVGVRAGASGARAPPFSLG